MGTKKRDLHFIEHLEKFTAMGFWVVWVVKMASLLAVQTLFSTPKKFFVDPPSMAYGKSRNAKKPDLGLFILELLAKIKKNGKN